MKHKKSYLVINSNCFVLQERDFVLGQLKKKAAMASETLNSLDGITCNSIQGAMYAFPQIYLPENAIKAAKV